MPAPDEPVTLIRELLLKNPHGLNIREIAKQTGYNRMSVAKYLDILLAQGIVGKRMIGNAKVYYLSRQIPVTTYMEYTSKHYCITDSSLRVVQLNEWVPDTAGMEEEDFINRYLPDTLEGVVVNLGECMAAMEKALEGEVTTVIVEEDFMGVHKFFEILHMPVRFPDGSNGMMAVSQEITDRKKVEIALRMEGKRFRDLLEGLPGIVFSTDPAGVLTYLSPRAADYGIVPGEFEGRTFGDLAVPGDREAVASALLSVNESGVAGGIRFRAALPGGRFVTMEADCMARYTEAGILDGISITVDCVPVLVPVVVNNPSSSGSSSGSGGGSNTDTGVGASENLKAGQSASFTFEGKGAVDGLSVTVGEDTPKIMVTVKSLSSLPSGVDEPGSVVYEYEEVTEYFVDSSGITGGQFEFRVSKSWLASNCYELGDIVMLHYNEETGVWEELETAFVKEDGGYYYYSAATPSFSWFAIAVEEGATIVQEGTAQGTPGASIAAGKTAESTTTAAGIPSETAVAADSNDSGGNSSWTSLAIPVLLIVLVIVVIAGIVARKRKEKYPDWWDKELK